MSNVQTKKSTAIKTKRKQRDLKILELHAKNVPNTEIAKMCDVSIQTVFNRIQEFSPVFKELKNVTNYRDAKSDLLSATELSLLKQTVSKQKLEKADLRSVAYAFDVINKANRLENNQSTENVAHLFTKVQTDYSKK